jgi:hypothetical protein
MPMAMYRRAEFKLVPHNSRYMKFSVASITLHVRYIYMYSKIPWHPQDWTRTLADIPD